VGKGKPRWPKRATWPERWVKPQLVADVTFADWTPDGSIRHAIFVGLRDDKPARQVKRETIETPAGAMPIKRTLPLTKVSHPERVIDPSTGATKLDLVRYYESVTDWLLPHLKGRPCSLVRGPDGISGEIFFQKHLGKVEIAGIKSLDRKLWPEHEALLEVATPKAIASAAQMNVIEFHTWNASVRHIDKPDRMVFDLDPGERVAWPRVQEAATLVRSFLQELGLQAWLKTSGGKGLHVIVPLAPRHDWDTVKGFSQAVVEHLAEVVPDRFSAKSGAQNRVGKIFVDYIRNSHGATTAAAYSARARPGLGVSMPIAWEQLATLKSGAQWTIASAREYLSFQKSDPWADYWTGRQTLMQAMKRLGYNNLARAQGH
jgi:bifunctional non-homologous end joining protein LigD